MKLGTRNAWIAATLALALGAGELVAYQGIAPHAAKLRDPGRVALKAARIVTRDLSVLVAQRAQHIASIVALHGVEQTSRLYRLASRALGVANDATPCVSADPNPCPDANPEVEAVMVSEPDSPCDASPGCTTVRVSNLSCPACPACPSREIMSRVIERTVERSVRNVTRRVVVKV
jgi:hypothetical protein